MTPPNGAATATVGPTTRPTHVRYSVLFMLCLLAMITYMDRAMYGSAKSDMMSAVGRPVEDFFWVLVAFQLAYACFEIPTGWLGDTYGPRVTLLRIVIWWSLFVALTGFAGYEIAGVTLIPFAVLVGMQFLFGMGEAGAFPNISKAVYNWFPSWQRGFAKGAVWMSARFMGGLTPLVWVLLVELGGLGWRQALWLFAGIAALWCVGFYIWFTSTPDEHPDVNEAEREIIAAGRQDSHSHDGVPWKAIFTNRNVIALCLMYTVTNFNWYFLMYYLPGALKREFSEWNLTDGGKVLLAILGGAPLLVGMFGCMLGGVLSDRFLQRTGNRKWARRIPGMVGYGGAGLCYLSAVVVLSAMPGNLWLFAACLIAVGFTNDLIMAPSWAAAQDIGGRYSAIVSGSMNMIGNLGATLGNLITGLVLKSYTVNGEVEPTGFKVCFGMYAAVYMAGVVAWFFIDTTRPLTSDLSEPPTEPETQPTSGTSE